MPVFLHSAYSLKFTEQNAAPGICGDSNHDLQAYPNLASRMKLTGIHQLRVADITGILLQTEFAYLAVIPYGYWGRWWAGRWSERWPANY
jgi:hypothetical protein